MGARRGTDKLFSQVVSDVTPIGDPVILTGLDLSKVHCFAGVKFYANAAGTTEAVPTVGSVAITIQTINTEPRFEAGPNNDIDASAPTTVTWAANTQTVKATPAGIDVATHYKLVVTCNET